MLKAFIDESGSGGDSQWYILAGYIGTVEGWSSFDAEWTAVLHKTPRIEFFKASEAESLRPHGQWSGVSREQRDEKIDALIEVISRCARRSICARMRQSDYDEHIKGKIPAKWDDPYYFLQTFIIGAAINIERADGESESIDFVFDKHQRHEKRLPQMLPAILPMKSVYQSIVGISFRDEKEFLPLQAADLLAWQIRRFLSTNEQRPQFHTSRNSLPKDPHTFIVDRKLVKDMIVEMQQRATKLSDSLGRSPDLRTWR